MVTYFTAPAWVSGSSDVEIITSIRLVCAYSPYLFLKISYDTDKENLTVQNSWSSVCGHAGSIFHHLQPEAYLHVLDKLAPAIACKLFL